MLHFGTCFTAQKQVDEIRNAMIDLESYTCIKFRYRTAEEDFVNIVNGEGCSSVVGRIGGKQELSLDSNGCVNTGTIQHELIHALGYTHMQNHVDRDDFVSIFWNNIDPSNYINFEKVAAYDYGNFDTPYDFNSVMHYSNTGEFDSPSICIIFILI